MNTFYYTCLYSLLLILSTGLNAQQITWSQEQKILTGHGSNIRPRILALDEDHGIMVWGNEHSSSIHYALWENDVLSPIYNINMRNTLAFITSWASTEIAGRNQYVYIVYKENPADVGKIYLMRSTDYGKTFTHQIVVVDNNGFKCRFPGVAIDKDNQPIVSYMRFKDDWSDPEYVSIRSTDYGDTFDPFTEVTDTSKGEACDCCPVGMETDGGDRIAVFYRNNRNNIRNMTAAISLDNGLSYNITKELDTANWFLMSCPSTGGDGFFNGPYLYTTWNSGRTGISKTYYSRLNLDTKEIDDFYIMNHNQGRNLQQVYPRMAGYQDTVGIAWGELATNMDVFFTYFTGTNSVNLIPNTVKINNDRTGNQASPDLAYIHGAFYLCWQDMNDNTIRFKKGVISNVTSQEDVKSKPEITVRTFEGGIFINSEDMIDSWNLYDVNGNEIADGCDEYNAAINLHIKGVYFLYVIVNNEQQLIKIPY
jgi:hypothetical protein